MIKNRKSEAKRIKIRIVVFLIGFWVLHLPDPSFSQEVNRDGWPIPDLKGLIPYSIQVKQVDRVEKMVEKFYTPDGGHVARISGNGKTFAYAVDSDQDPPIDYFLLDPEGFGKFTLKFRSEDSYKIPEWVSR